MPSDNLKEIKAELLEINEMLSEETWSKLNAELSYDNITLSEEQRAKIIQEVDRAIEQKYLPFCESHRIKDQVTFSKLVDAYRALPKEDKGQFHINLNGWFRDDLVFSYSNLDLTDAQRKKRDEFFKSLDKGRSEDPFDEMLESLLEIERGAGKPCAIETEAKECLFVGIASFFEENLELRPAKTVNGRFVCFMEILLSDPFIVKELGGPMTCNSINKFWKEID